MSQHTSFAKLAAQFQTVNLKTLLWRANAKADAAGLAPIYLRITVDGRRLERSTGLRVTAAEWDVANGRIKGTSALVKLQNEQLQLAKAHIVELTNLMKATGRPVSARTLAVQMESPSLGDAPSPCFVALCQQQLELHYGGNPTSYAARQHGVNTLLDWRGRTKDGKAVPLPVEDFTPELAAAFYQWLLVSRRQKVSTANTVVSTLGTLFRRAAEMRLVDLAHNPFRFLRLKKKAPTVRLRLSMAQFATLRDAELSAKHGLARDVYVAQYYLHGSRVGAVLKLRWQDVSATHVRLQVEKGGPLKSIRISPELARVLARYRPEEAGLLALVFPVLPPLFHSLSLEKQFQARKRAHRLLDGRLCSIAEALGLPAGLHTHTARHTLALHAASAAGLRVAQTMLGHASVRQTERYVGELPDEALNEAEQLLYGVSNVPSPPPAPAPDSPEGGRVVPLWRVGNAA